MSSEANPGTASPATIHPQAVADLKKLKETEATWQKRLEEARTRGETKIKYAQAARDRAVADAQRAAEEARGLRLREARTQAETEAKRILEEARASLGPLGNLSGSEVDARMEDVLTAIFGDLRSVASAARKGTDGSSRTTAPPSKSSAAAVPAR